LATLDKAKLRQRACAIAECADTSVLFDAGESDESLDDADFEEPSSAEVIRLKRIYNFLCSMLVFTPFAYCFVTHRGTFMHFPELTY
jgi:hypothetical protein